MGGCKFKKGGAGYLCLGAEAVLLRVWYLQCCRYVTALLLQSLGQMILRAASWSVWSLVGA